MAQRFKTTFVIDGDSTGAVQAQRAARQETEQLNREMTLAAQRGEEMASSFETAQSRAATFATVVGASATAIGAISLAQIQAAQQAGIMADALDMSVQRLQELQYAARQKGIDDIGDILKDVSDKIGDAFANGGGEAMDAINNLNLSINDLIALKPDEQLLALAQGLKDLPTGAQVNIMESLGNDAVRLLPLLEDNGRLLQELTDQAQHAGVALSDIDNQQLLAAGDALGEMQGYAEGLANQLALKVAPAIIDTAEGVSDLVDDFGGMENVAGTLTTAVGGLAAVLGTRLAVSLAGSAAAVAKKTTTDVAAAKAELAAAQMAERRTAAELHAAQTLRARALAEARALSGTNAHAFAMENLARASARATAAEAAHTAAVNTSSAAMTRASAVARGFSGALALLGGPAGAVIMAVGALAIYHDELDDMLAPAQRATQRVNDLTNAINLNSEAAVEGQLVNLTAQMVQLEQQAAAARQQLDEINSTSNDPGPFRNSMVLGEDAEKRREAYETLREAQEQLEANGQASEELRKRLQMLRDQGVKTVSTVSQLGSANDEAAKAADAFSSSLLSLEDRLFPVEKAQRDFAQAQILLQTALMKGEIGIDRYLVAWDRLQQSARSGENWQDAYGMNGDGVKELEKMSDAARDLGFTFSSAFENAIIEGNSFRDVLSGIAEDIARIALRKSVSEPFANWLGTAISGVSFGFGGATGGTYSGGTLGSLYADGGYTGPGGKYEPAGIVHAGEYVIQKDVVEQPGVRDFLDRLNSGQGYASGGYVGAATSSVPSIGYASGGYVAPVAMQSPNSQPSSAAPSVAIPIEVKVTAQPGASSQDAARQGGDIGRALKATILTVIQNEMRPGGVLASRRG